MEVKTTRPLNAVGQYLLNYYYEASNANDKLVCEVNSFFVAGKFLKSGKLTNKEVDEIENAATLLTDFTIDIISRCPYISITIDNRPAIPCDTNARKHNVEPDQIWD